MQLNAIGEIAFSEWLRSADMRTEIMLDAFVMMPNHLHGIIFIDSATNTVPKPAIPASDRSGPHTISTIVNGFKAAATRRIRALDGLARASIWQRNYYEHIIRNQRSLDAIREYIANNPANWANDRENPMSVRLAKGVADWQV